MFRHALRALNKAKPLLGQPSPALRSSIQTSATLSRILGGSKARAIPLEPLTSAVSKTEGKGLAGVSALLGRAVAYLSRPLSLSGDDAAASDIAAAIAESANSKDKSMQLLHRYALALALKVRNVQLRELEHSMKVSGACNEMQIASNRQNVAAAYKALLAISPNDPLVLLGFGEFELSQGNYDAALELFASVEKLLPTLTAGDYTEVPATVENLSAALLVSFKLTTALPKVDTSDVKSTIVKEALAQLSERATITADELRALRAELQAPDAITDSELVSLGVTLANASKGHHLHDFFPLKEEYHAWHSEKASHVHHEVSAFMFGKGVALTADTLATVRSTKPKTSFYASPEELKALLAKPKPNVNLLDDILETFGEGPKSQLSQRDAVFYQSLNELAAEPACNFAGGSHGCGVQQQQLIRDLVEQLQYRLAVDKALALTQTSKPHEALALLDKVVKADAYVRMWEAFLARGRVREVLGMVKESDEDLKQVFEMREAYVGADIPLRDENRTKSVF